MMGVRTDRIVGLKELSEDHCWSIFRQLAFIDRSSKERQQLEPIGQKIAAKSRDLPLVAKTLASLMGFKKTSSQWEDILGSQLWESNDAKVRDVFAPFLLSYYDLSALEKSCFLYCSIFPQDYDIRRNDLIEMWMSQGYLGRGVDSWKIGRDCFETLAMRSFFQEIKEFVYDGDVKCKMHDIVLEFANFLTGDECVYLEAENKAVVEANTRHLTLKGPLPNSLGNAKNLRSLFFVASGLSAQTSLFTELTYLRTLSLSFCDFKQLPEDIGLLKHLRYLDLSYNRLVALPEKLFDLCNLETLNLCACLELETLPECISKLVSLKHLYISDCPLESLPKGLGKLSGLQTLDMIVLAKERGSYLDIGDLKHLQPRGYLHITGLGYTGSTMDDVAKMNLNGITSLEIYFTRDLDFNSVDRNNNDAEILNSIQPHPNLIELEIQNYLGLVISPAWMMSLSNLTHLDLNGFLNCETLPPLGKLPSLESLDLERFHSVCMVDEEFLGITGADREFISFPKLEHLRFSWISQWRVWEGFCTKTTKIMPCLSTLKIYNCDSLETLPEFLQTTPLQELTIWGRETMAKHCQKEVGKEWHKISHVPNILDNNHMQKNGVWIQTDMTK